MITKNICWLQWKLIYSWHNSLVVKMILSFWKAPNLFRRIWKVLTYLLCTLLFSFVQVQAQELNFGFGPKMNTKVAFNTTTHPPTTENFWGTSRQARGIKFCEHINLEQIKSDMKNLGPPLLFIFSRISMLF